MLTSCLRSTPLAVQALIASIALVAAPACGGGSGDEGTGSGESDDGSMPVPTATMAECPSDSTLTYDDFAAPFFAMYCLDCHDSALTGTERLGAPPMVDFEEKLKIAQHADEIDSWAGAAGDVVNEFMPPSAPKPSLADREDLAEWIACGMP